MEKGNDLHLGISTVRSSCEEEENSLRAPSVHNRYPIARTSSPHESNFCVLN